MNCVKSVKPKKSDEKRTDQNASSTKTEINPESRATISAVSEQPKPVVEPKAAEVSKDDGDKKSVLHKISESEFVSDEFQTSNETDLAEIKDGMRKLGIDSMTQQALPSNDGKRGIVSKNLIIILLSSLNTVLNFD